MNTNLSDGKLAEILEKAKQEKDNFYKNDKAAFTFQMNDSIEITQE